MVLLENFAKSKPLQQIWSWIDPRPVDTENTPHAQSPWLAIWAGSRCFGFGFGLVQLLGSQDQQSKLGCVHMLCLLLLQLLLLPVLCMFFAAVVACVVAAVAGAAMPGLA